MSRASSKTTAHPSSSSSSSLTSGSRSDFITNIYGEEFSNSGATYDQYEPLGHVVRILRLSSDENERAKRREALLAECARLEVKMDEIINVHYDDLNESLRIFQNVVSHVTDSKQRLGTLRSHISQCKEFLQFKRDKLRQLWIEHVEYKEMIRLLDKIDNVRRVPDQIETLVNSFHYLRASRLIMDTMRILEYDLSSIGALSDLQHDLNNKKKKLYDIIIEELHNQIYQKDVKFETSAAYAAKIAKAEKEELATKNESSSLSLNHAELRKQNRSEEGEDFIFVGAVDSFDTKRRPMREHQTDNDVAPEPKSDAPHFVFMLIESLSLLDQIPAAVKSLQQSITKELSKIVKDAIKFVEDTFVGSPQKLQSLHSNSKNSFNIAHQPLLLLELLNIIFNKFNDVLKCHVFALQVFRFCTHHQPNPSQRSKRANSTDSTEPDGDDQFQLYTEEDVWSAAQYEIQLLLCDYLNVPKDRSSAVSTFLSTINTPEEIVNADILMNPSSLMEHKNLRKKTLFSFSNSHHAIALNSISKNEDIKARSLSGAGLAHNSVNQIADDLYLNPSVSKSSNHLLCHPSPRNVVHIFATVLTFTKKIESNVLPETTPSNNTLGKFLLDFVEETFLRLEKDSITKQAKAAMEGPDAFKVPRDRSSVKDTQYPLLQSFVAIDSLIRQVCFLPLEMPTYAKHFMEIISEILTKFQELCSSIFKEIIHGHSQKSSTNSNVLLSETWANDPNLLEIVIQLNSWKRLKGNNVTVKNFDLFEDSDPKIYEQEYTIQSAVVGGKLLAKSALIYDIGVVKFLASIHHSMEWLCHRIKTTLRRLVQVPDELWTELLNDGAAGAVPVSFDTLGTGGARQRNGLESQLHLRQVDENNNITPQLLSPISPVISKLRELSKECLFILRFEIRCRCFHALIPVMQKTNYYCEKEETEPDPLITGLNKELNLIEETLSSSLSGAKLRFLFDGIPFLCKVVLSRNIHFIKRINKHGVSKICRSVFALEQNLSNIIKSGDTGLEKARKFFELLVHKREEILQEIESDGPVFSQSEYASIFNLIHASKAGEEESVHTKHIERLNKLFSKSRSRSYSQSQPQSQSQSQQSQSNQALVPVETNPFL